jgi:hypothetical protein
MSATFEDKKRAEFADPYGRLMNEIRARLDSIDVIRKRLIPYVPPYISIESEYLQLRIVCELIAVGCLLAHGDISATHAKQLRKSKYPSEIIPALEKLHPDFYPVPFDVNGERETVVSDGFLTKEKLLELYGECSGAVHRGSLHSLAKGPQQKIERVGYWVNLIKRLLVHHRITLVDSTVALRFFIGPQTTSWGVFHEITEHEYEAVESLPEHERIARLETLRQVQPDSNESE